MMNHTAIPVVRGQGKMIMSSRLARTPQEIAKNPNFFTVTEVRYMVLRNKTL